jgi:CRISPR-associated protein Cas1
MQSDDLPISIKNGTLVLSGHVASVTTKRGRLVIKDGIRGNVIEREFPRANCPISRLISTQGDGLISFAAVRWLNAIGATFAHLAVDGTPLMLSMPASNPVSRSDRSNTVGLRRRQIALAYETRLGKALAHAIVAHKITGQAAVLRSEGYEREAAQVDSFGALVSNARNIDALLSVEGKAAVSYWDTFALRSLRFARTDTVPGHWLPIGNRNSPLSGSARNAVTPAHAVINYLYAVMASEITIALHAAGLDPALGVLHLDKEDRASLAYDLLELARPTVDSWAFRWLSEATFNKRDFFEDSRGAVTIVRPLSAHLALTAPMWRKVAEPLVTWFHSVLLSEKVIDPPVTGLSGSVEHAAFHAQAWKQTGRRQVPATCMHCGKALNRKQRKFCSHDCARTYSLLISGSRMIGFETAHSPAARVKRGVTMQRVNGMRIAWETLIIVDGVTNEQLQAALVWFKSTLAPQVQRLSTKDMAEACGVTRAHAGLWKRQSRRGEKVQAHTMHFGRIAALAGIAVPVELGRLFSHTT